MIVKSARVQNFRSILDATLPCEQLTALVGANGAGKSSFLKAIEMFYSSSPKVEVDDFYNRDTTKEIVVTITFEDLQPEAKTLFVQYLQGNELTVERVFKWKDTKCESKLHGSIMRNPEFEEFRLATEDGATPARAKYEAIRGLQRYNALPKWTSMAAAKETISRWEEENKEACSRSRDDGAFFGFQHVGEGYLGKFTMLRYIPAVRDASTDALDKGNSVITELMDLVVRDEMAQKEEIKTFEEETRKKHSALVDVSKLSGLTNLVARMNATMQRLAPDSKIDVRWLPAKELEMTMPTAEVKLVEDGYESTVARTGHGLQRAFIMTILQHLSEAQGREGLETDASQENLPSLLLIIEEPELYQHPNRQRHLARVLQTLSKSRTLGVANVTQVIYSTHSPHFVNIEGFNQIRLLRKVKGEGGKPKVTVVSHTTLQTITEDLTKITGETATNQSGKSIVWQLRTIMTSIMNEGFFSDGIVLLEGEEDRAALIAAAENLNIDLESKGLSIIPCGGKPNILRPALIFRRLGIPIYVIWDGDKDGKSSDPKLNHHLLTLMGWAPEDWPKLIDQHFACFESTLNKTMKEELGEGVYNGTMESTCKTHAALERHAIKNPVIMSELIRSCNASGKHFTSLEKIVREIERMYS